MNKLFKLIKESLSGDEQRDYTKISINTAIVLLSIPMIIEMFFEALFALVDAFFVAKYVGIEGVATVGLTESVLTLIYSLAWGLSAAATAIIARRIGENNEKDASKSVAQIILVSVSIGIIIAILGFIYSTDILKIMGASEKVISDGIWYTRISFLSSPIIILLFTLSGALRGSGSASMAMKAVIIANIINIVLDFIFLPVMGMGVEGAALATMIGRSVGICIQLWALIGDSGKIKLFLSQFIPDKELITNIIKVASGAAGQFLIQSASWVFLVRIVSIYGSEVVAGYTIALRIIVFTILPSWGMANSAATLVGQNLGAKQPERAEKSAWTISFLNMGFLFLIMLIFFGFSETFISFFDTNPIVVKTGSDCLKILAAGYVFFGIGMVITQAINGAGDTFTPTVFNIICFWGIEIPLAYYLARSLEMKQNGVFLSIIIAESILAVMAIIYFKRGRWKKFEV
jgi:putative MATE family efflux protein